MRGVRTSQEIRDRVVKLYTEEKHGIPVVAEMVGIPSPTVFVILKSAGIHTGEKRRRDGQTGRKIIRWESRGNKEEIDAMIRRDYELQGPSPICKHFGLTDGVVSKRAWVLGIKCTTHIARKNVTLASRNDNCDQSFFDHWHPNLAWLLGYTWTDGAVSNNKGNRKIHYRAAIQDEKLIMDIHAAIGSKAGIQRFKATAMVNHPGKNYVGQPQVGFSVSSQLVVNRMIDQYGIIPNKSNLNPPMPDIPDDMMPHFTRGVIDGDGSICGTGTPGRIQVVINGSHQFVEKLRHRAAKCAGVKVPNASQHGTSLTLSRFAWSAKDDLYSLIPWLYPSGEYLHIARKRKTAEEYFSNSFQQTTGDQKA